MRGILLYSISNKHKSSPEPASSACAKKVVYSTRGIWCTKEEEEEMRGGREKQTLSWAPVFLSRTRACVVLSVIGTDKYITSRGPKLPLARALARGREEGLKKRRTAAAAEWRRFKVKRGDDAPALVTFNYSGGESAYMYAEIRSFTGGRVCAQAQGIKSRHCV